MQKRWLKWGKVDKERNFARRKFCYFCAASPPCLHEAGSEVYLKHGKKRKKIGRVQRKKEREFIKERKQNTFVLKTRPVSMRRVGRLSFPKKNHFSENYQTTKNRCCRYFHDFDISEENKYCEWVENKIYGSIFPNWKKM